MAQEFPSPLNPRAGPIDLTFSRYDAAIAAGQEAAATNPLSSVLTSIDLYQARNDDNAPSLSLAEQSSVIEEANLTGMLEPDEGETLASLDLMIDLKREELARQTVMENVEEGITSSAAMLGTGLFVSMLDPINVASAFVPIVGPARYAAMLRQKATTFGRFAVRSRVGAAEGALGAAMVEPIVYLAAQDRQADYDLYDTYANLAFGTALGGGLHGVGGFVKDQIVPPITQRHITQIIENLSPEAQQSAFNGTIGQLANGRMVQGVDYILRADLENSTAVGSVGSQFTGFEATARQIDDDKFEVTLDAARTSNMELDGEEAIRSTRESLGAVDVGANGEAAFPAQAAEGLDDFEAAQLATTLQGAGIRTEVRATADGTYAVDMFVPTEMVARNPDGSYLSYQTKKAADKARKSLTKEGVIERGTAVKIGDEYFIVQTTDKNVVGAFKNNADNIVLPTEFPAFNLSQALDEGTGRPRVVPETEYAANALERSHSPDNRIFDAQERDALARAEADNRRMFDDLDEATARQETDEQLADVDRLKTELTDEPLLEPVVNESEAELAAADEAIESTQQTSDGFRQAAACVLQGLV